MRRALFIMLVSFIAAGCGQAANTSPTAAHWLDVVCEQSCYLHSELSDRQSLAIPVRLTNVSGQGVSVALRGRSCNCLDIQVPQSRIGPGETLCLTAGIRNVQESGDHSARFTLLTEGDDGSVQDLECVATVTVLPDRTAFPRVIRNEFTNEEVKAVSLKYSEFYRKSPAYTVPPRPSVSGVPDEAILREVTGPFLKESGGILEAEWTILLEFRNVHSVERGIDGRLHIRPDADDPLQVPFHVSRKTGLEVSPLRHWLGPAKRGQILIRRSVVRARDSVPFLVTSCRSSHPAFTAKTLTTDSRTAHVVEVCFDGSCSESCEATIAIATTHGTGSEVIVSVISDGPSTQEEQE